THEQCCDDSNCLCGADLGFRVRRCATKKQARTPELHAVIAVGSVKRRQQPSYQRSSVRVRRKLSPALQLLRRDILHRQAHRLGRRASREGDHLSSLAALKRRCACSNFALWCLLSQPSVPRWHLWVRELRRPFPKLSTRNCI